MTGLLRRSLRARLVAASMLIEAVMLALLLGNSMRLIATHLERQTEARIEAMELAYKTAVAVPLASRDYATLRDILDGWRKAADIQYLVVTDRGGQALAASGWTHGTELPPVSPVPARATPAHVRFSVDFQGQTYGYVQYGLDTSFIAAARQQLVTQGAAIALAEVALSALLLSFVGYLLTRHLAALTTASREIAAGQYATRLVEPGPDEVGQLAHNFNLMAEAVQARVTDLQAEEERLRAIADYTYAWENWFGPDGRPRWVNPAVERITGYTPDDCMRMPEFPVPLVHPDDRALVRRQMAQALDGQTGQDQEFRVQRRDGSVIWVAVSWQPIFARDGASLGFRSSVRDITLQHRAAEELEFQATHDPLTGLYNRRAFEQALYNLLARPVAQRPPLAVLYIDLDQFKVVNDTHGHAAGDELLRRLARHFRDSLDYGLLARLGGDEFGMILTGLARDEVQRRAERIVDAVAGLPFAWEGDLFRIAASVGVAEAIPGLDSVTELLIAADSACYLAKERGRNRVVVYAADDEQLQARREELWSLTEMSDALEEQRFILCYQRLAALTPGRADHAEVLVRLVGRDGEPVSPARFIPAAERYNLMPYVDRWVVTEVCRRLASWKNAGRESPFPVLSVNLSGASLSDTGLADFLRDTFAEYAVAPQSLCFEITETAAVTHLERALEAIQALRGLGCRIALDDFGAGLSSFAYLKRFAVDTLKIDGMFVRNADRDPSNRAIVESIVRVAQAHGLATVAEFVASAEVLQLMRELGVDYAQGYAVHEPQPLDRA